MRRYADYLAGRSIDRIEQIDEAVVAAFLVSAARGDDDHPHLGAGSAARTVVAVRGWHRFCVREGLTSTDVAAQVRPPTPPRRLPKAISVDDVERLLHAAGAEETPLAVRDRALLELLYGTGARISEAVGLDVDDVDLDDGVARLWGKGSKQRMVPIGSYAVAAVSAYLVRARPVLATGGSRPSTPALFLNARGGRLSRQSAWAVLARPRPAPVSPSRCRRTPCGTPSRPICSTAAPMCASCRSCSVTRR